jgi:cytochrome c553
MRRPRTMALKKLLGAALVVSLIGLAGCSQPVKKDPGATTAPPPVTTETPATAETPDAPAATGTPVADTGSSAGGEMADYELAEGMGGYDEVLELKDSIPPSTPESITKGQEVYAANCALCHGDTGMGDGAGGAALDPPPRNLTVPGEYKYGHMDLALYRTGTYGVEGTGMSPFEGMVSVEDMWAVGHYIRSIQK